MSQRLGLFFDITWYRAGSEEGKGCDKECMLKLKVTIMFLYGVTLSSCVAVDSACIVCTSDEVTRPLKTPRPLRLEHIVTIFPHKALAWTLASWLNRGLIEGCINKSSGHWLISITSSTQKVQTLSSLLRCALTAGQQCSQVNSHQSVVSVADSPSRLMSLT